MKKILAETLRQQCAERGGTSILSDTKLILIDEDRTIELPVTMEFGAHYTYIEN